MGWPDSKRALLIGFIGDQSTGLALKKMLDQKPVDDRKLQVLLNPPDWEISNCDLLYVTSSETAKTGSIVSKLRKLPILTIGENDKFVQMGGVVALIRSGDQIQIEVNTDALHHAGLRMSSRLLDLATIVSTESN